MCNVCSKCDLIDMEKAVQEFHKAFGIPVSDKPTTIDLHSFSRRVRLIDEDLAEYCKAVSENDIVGIADALGDLLYVVYGTGVEHGLPMNQILQAIHEFNMTKTGGKLDESGKLVKPSTYKPVDLSWLKSI